MSISVGQTPLVRVNIPAALRTYTDSERTVELEGHTVGQVLDALASRYPRLKQHLFDDGGDIRSFVTVYLGDEDIRHLERRETVLATGQELSIVPSIAGGA